MKVIKNYIYPALSLLSFILISYYPLVAIILILASAIFITIYLSLNERDIKSDIGSIIVIFILSIYLYKVMLIYILAILLPILLFHYLRRYLSATTNYLSIILPPLILSMITTCLTYLSPEIYTALFDSVLLFISDLTAPAKETLERFDNNSFFAYLINNQLEATKLFIQILPSIQYSLLLLLIFFIDKLRNIFNDKEEPVIKFRLPDHFVWGFILSGSLILINSNISETIALNFIIIYAVLYFTQGIELFNILFDKYKLSRFMRAVIFIVFYTEPIIVFIVALIGLFNIWIKPKIFIEEIPESNETSK